MVTETAQLVGMQKKWRGNQHYLGLPNRLFSSIQKLFQFSAILLDIQIQQQKSVHHASNFSSSHLFTDLLRYNTGKKKIILKYTIINTIRNYHIYSKYTIPEFRRFFDSS